VNDSVADRRPVALGEKETETLQVPPPAATVAPLQESAVLVKSPAFPPPSATPDTVNGPEAGLVRVTDRAALVVLTV
jgi:hypothetical protein